MNGKAILNFLTCLTAITVLQSPALLHAQDGCQPIFDALTKAATTSSHSYSIHTLLGKTTSSETIYAQNKAFIRVKGKWMASPDGPKEILEQESENRKQGAATCKVVREESVNGQPATVYSLHSKTEDGTEDAQMWIAKGTGLPLRKEMDMDVGGGNMGKSHVSIRYEYGNIHPPM